jgi:redox-sensitive bicupin YhaK (pirin superfamily)
MIRAEDNTMMQLRAANSRGHARYDWLNTYHSFSFADYYDPLHMGISNLRVINEDTIAPGGGFPTHGHRDMEIVTYVLSGALEHQDSMGNGSVIRPGDIQRMSAGSGVRHSEFNASDTEPVHLLQIWLLPNRPGVMPGYEQRHFPIEQRRDVLCLLVSPDGREGSLSAHQDALLYGSLLAGGEALNYTLAPDRKAYVHLARGVARINDSTLEGGDGLRIAQEPQLRIQGLEEAEILLFDLP